MPNSTADEQDGVGEPFIRVDQQLEVGDGLAKSWSNARVRMASMLIPLNKECLEY